MTTAQIQAQWNKWATREEALYRALMAEQSERRPCRATLFAIRVELDSCRKALNDLEREAKRQNYKITE